MARGRLISRTLGSSRKFAALLKQAGKLGEFAQTLFPLLVATSDDFGRQAGDAFTVKLAVFPSSPRRDEDFKAALTAMHHVGLIRLYEANNGQVIQIVDFDEHQVNLHKRTDSKFPESPGNSGLRELNLTELKRRESKAPPAQGEGESSSSLFAVFWDAYPNKKSRAAAEKAWKKLTPSPALLQRILGAIAAQRNSPQWLQDGGRFVPYGSTWLNNRRWEDEPEGVPPVELLPPVPDWFEECQRLHDGACNGSYAHGLKMDIDAMKAATV